MQGPDTRVDHSDRSQSIFSLPFYSWLPVETSTCLLLFLMQVASYTNFFADALIAEAERDSRIIGVHAAMGGGTGMNRFQKRFNSRTFDVGIAEQHAVTFAAGLACEGMAPFVAIYSTFLQRGYDQIVHDVCLQKLPGTLPCITTVMCLQS